MVERESRDERRDSQRFSPADIDAVYRAIFSRRDMRHFNGQPMAEGQLERLIKAAHAAPSVGYMQPWRFIHIQSPQRRAELKALVAAECERTSQALSGTRAAAFKQLKVEGISECSEVVVVSLMDGRQRHVFGRRTLPSMDLASASCAIQNLWLAARAEGIGVGWVSLFEPQALADLLALPEGAEPIAVLCIGPVDKFYEQPMLAAERWAQRGELADYVMVDSWDSEQAARTQAQWDEHE